ncbi:hypothetical protein ACIQCR_01425 [Streptomyces sp. NPDC093249]|uniref:hypothetical protein n=1 Tax=unclassified Streptomyces TaxID=2593676 RepID=UPI0038267DA8
MPTVTPFPAPASKGESPFGAIGFTTVRPSCSSPHVRTIAFAVPSGDLTVGTVGFLSMPLNNVSGVASSWLEFRDVLCADSSVRFRRTDRLDASALASGRGRPFLASRGLYKVEKRAYRNVFPRGLDAIARMAGTTPGSVFREDTPSNRMTELFLDDHEPAGRPAIVVVPSNVLRSSWLTVNFTRTEHDEQHLAGFFLARSDVGLLLEAAGFLAYGAFLHAKQDRGPASGLLSARLPKAVPVHLPGTTYSVVP